MTGRAYVVQGRAERIPLPARSVDLIITSPPYFGLRSYTDGGKHYAGQIGAEASPAQFVDALIDCTREWVRVLKPSGSIWVNLGDKYADDTKWGGQSGHRHPPDDDGTRRAGPAHAYRAKRSTGFPRKSLMDLPARYSIRCVDELGLIKRAEVIWSKPNGLPESVTDRVRRSHEQWFHFTVQPRYFSAIDEIREAHMHAPNGAVFGGRKAVGGGGYTTEAAKRVGSNTYDDLNPLGKLPGSVREVATEPLKLPAWLGVDHYAAFPTAWPRWIIQGWSPSGICTACGDGRRPVTVKTLDVIDRGDVGSRGSKFNGSIGEHQHNRYGQDKVYGRTSVTVSGYACACTDTSAPTRPAVVLDPFGGTGTTALVASVLGRVGISNDLSHDYGRAARWRTADPGERARALQVDKPPAVHREQGDLFDGALF